MRSVSIRLSDLDGGNKLIPIGFVGENEYTTVNIDCKKIFEQHPNAVPALAVTPPQGDSYPAIVVRDGDIISWTVCDSDLIYEGNGAFQLTFVVDETIVGKTYKARTKILGSIEPSGEAPTPIQNWLIQAAAALQALPQEVSDAVVAVMGAMVGVGETLNPGENVTVSYDTENNTLTIGVPRGADGQDGQDGHTPSITAEKVGKVTTLYVDGEAVATVEDGESGTELIDDNAGAGDTDKVWSADKSANTAQILLSRYNDARIKFREHMNYVFCHMRRKKLENTNFSIISNNCWAGHVYRYFRLPYATPTIGMYIWAEDYLTLLADLKGGLNHWRMVVKC